MGGGGAAKGRALPWEGNPHSYRLTAVRLGVIQDRIYQLAYRAATLILCGNLAPWAPVLCLWIANAWPEIC
jgi:hypothetical protein